MLAGVLLLTSCASVFTGSKRNVLFAFCLRFFSPILIKFSKNALVLLELLDGSPVPAGANISITNNPDKFMVAKNGEEGLMISETSTVDLVVCDIMMPGIDGYEVCRTLKSNPSTMNIPII